MLTRSWHIIVLFVILLPSTWERTYTTDKAERDDHQNVVKYVAILLFTAFILYAAVSNTLMMIILFHPRQSNHYKREFVLISSQLIICNFMALLPHIIVVLPKILHVENNSHAEETTWINRTFSTFATFPYFSMLHFSFLLAINRFVALILPKYYFVFESAKLYIEIAVVWLSVLVFTVVDFHYCTTEFNVQKMSWEADCEKSGGAKKNWWRIRFFWALFIPDVMFVIYVAMFYNIHRKHQKILKIRAGYEKNAMKIYHYEWLVLIHAAWNCGILETASIIFYFLPSFLIKVFGEIADIPSNIFINCYFIFICSMLPTFHFIYNKESHDFVKHHFYHLLNLRIGFLKNKVSFVGTQPLIN
ncbi:Caenorhabditis serpentine receptor-like protein class xa family protein [Acanthocheilonema viteae]